MPYFGPKVIAIARMSQALWMFFTFFLVFMVAYSICSIALIDLNLVPSLRTIRSLFFHGLWDIFGELGEEQSTGAIVGCPDNITEAGLFSTVDAFDCSIRQLTVQLLLALYLFIASVLLMNALIAVLTHIFDEINEGSTRVWRYQMYFLVKEYDGKFILRAPLVILYLLYLTVRVIFER
ncbi:unnamed protein product [Anisakis simplex]|uniref:Ion_trans domain-containing protein n=1 Tax=Anisakis simplex TaxID=6269 RepID=A0A0M3K185_ANISI|nr:unnamed protein product [Anisakis simplex]